MQASPPQNPAESERGDQTQEVSVASSAQAVSAAPDTTVTAGRAVPALAPRSQADSEESEELGTTVRAGPETRVAAEEASDAADQGQEEQMSKLPEIDIGNQPQTQAQLEDQLNL